MSTSAAALSLPVDDLLSRGALFRGGSRGHESRGKALPLAIPSSVSHARAEVLGAIEQALPDKGLTRGAVVELASPRGLARSTTVALAACASAQAEARLRGAEGTEGAWCAWIDPSATLYAPGAAQAGVDLSRLLVVRPSPEAFSRVAVRVAASRAFAVIVVDTVGAPGGLQGAARLDRWAVVVRRLALAVEGTDTTLLLLTDRNAHRGAPLPVAMRIELGRPTEERLTLRVAKDRRGRVAGAVSIPLLRSA